ncbi:cardiolipin synthase [Paraliobacillus quinghaiensis]|uniref:Cardiolipin synthase n=1 Tax=Paraliobacillus quinghaiensis TaxID=470815 RepID=A0A917WVQ8_9BACI|nr:cardiolipin synthase [Paraliobacillus quinghaiensis]GGM32835.1 cardiolipin synthase [Paraliobacillus quinghaiensis]
MQTIGLILIIILALALLDFQMGKRHFRKQPTYGTVPFQPVNYEMITTGDVFFESFFADLRAAKNNISISFFIVRNDQISQKLYEILKEKAREGVSVYLLVDWMGSLTLKQKTIRALRASGVNVQKSNPPSFPYFLYRLNRRNHRKIAIIDEKVSYLGGFNVGKEYLGFDPKLGDWRDYHIKCTDSELARYLQVIYNFDWDSTKQKRALLPSLPENESALNDHHFALHVTEAGQLEDILVNWLKQAKHSIHIGSPYFIPSKRVFDCLLDACNRGVDVTILAPEKRDHPFVKPTAFPYYREMLRAGAKVHFYDHGFYHAKLILLDENWCDLGTANFDKRSFLYNQEINLKMYADQEMLKPIREAFFTDLKRSFPVTEEHLNNHPLKFKIAGKIGKLIEPFL